MLNLGQLNTIKAYMEHGQFEALDEYLSQVYGKQKVGQLDPLVMPKMPEGYDYTYWEKQFREKEAESNYYQDELVKAHTLLGRVIHQLSERWDSVNLTKYYPTDNLWGKRTVGNSKGEKR